MTLPERTAKITSIPLAEEVKQDDIERILEKLALFPFLG